MITVRRALGQAWARGWAWLRARPLRAAALLLVPAGGLAGTAYLRWSPLDAALTVTVGRGDLTARLPVTGTIRPARSITYRSPLMGRESEVLFLVAEGTVVGEGDLLVRLDATQLGKELERAVRDLRQARVEVQVAELEQQEGAAALESLNEGAGAVSVEETRAGVRLAEKKVQRLRDEYESLRPLLEKGFITRDELERSAFELETAESDLRLAKRKAEIYIERTHPRDKQRARLQLTQRQARLNNAQARVGELEEQVRNTHATIEACNLYARAPGLVVHELFLGSSPRRKVRVGDRVTASQGLVTIPEVQSMLVEAQVPEADVHRVRPGQPVTIRLDAFPDLHLTGKVARVGTLAQAAGDAFGEGKRFDLIVEVDPGEAALRPEMTARAEILVGQRRGVLLLPVNAVFEHDGAPVCHVLHRFQVETRRLELGLSDGVYVEVLAGLTEGTRVALADIAGAPPPAALPDAAPHPLLRRQAAPGVAHAPR